MSSSKLIEYREDISSDFDGTVVDIETIGEFNKLHNNDSRRCESLQQVILGFINRRELRIFCARSVEAIENLAESTKQAMGRLERPFYAFNAGFESSVWFHQLGLEINFDGELQSEKFETKANARKILGISNYNDPFYDVGYDCCKAWESGDFDRAIAHNRACLLKERDILILRGFRKPDKIRFIK